MSKDVCAKNKQNSNHSSIQFYLISLHFSTRGAATQEHVFHAAETGSA